MREGSHLPFSFTWLITLYHLSERTIPVSLVADCIIPLYGDLAPAVVLRPHHVCEMGYLGSLFGRSEIRLDGLLILISLSAGLSA